jgi:hypothetical protein
VQRALAQHDVIAVQCLEPPVQYLKYRLCVLLVFRRGADQFSAYGEGLGKTAAVVINRQLRSLRVRIGRIEFGRAAECVRRVIEAPEPIQQVCSMQMIFRDSQISSSSLTCGTLERVLTLSKG